MLRATQSVNSGRVSSGAGRKALLQPCRALPLQQQQQAEATAGRRAMLLSTVTPLLFSFVSPALALIPDEEDEELVEKAKANRASRLELERKTTQVFLKEAGLKDAKLEQNLIPIQKAVFKLAESGSKIEGGDVKAASDILSEDWVFDFTVASGKMSTGSNGLGSKLQELQAATKTGDSVASKRAYVALVAELQSWTASSGLGAKLKGL